MKEIFTTLLYQPIFNGFIGLYNVIPDVGAVILVLTLLIKGSLLPLSKSAINSQKSLQTLQPKLEAVKKKYKDDQQKLAQETMKMYKENKVNPFGSCLPILIQLPVFLGLFYVLKDVFDQDSFHLLYSFVSNPGEINPITLGLFDLSQRSVVLALMAGGAQFWQAKSMQRKKAPKDAGDGAKDENMMAMMNKQMLYFMPVITVIIGIQFPAGLTLYWFLSTLVTAVQQHVMFKKKDDEVEVLPAV